MPDIFDLFNNVQPNLLTYDSKGYFIMKLIKKSVGGLEMISISLEGEVV